jgi:hypothetical protein
MESPKPPLEPDNRPNPRIWCVLTDALPDGELVMPIVTQDGIALAIRDGQKMGEELVREMNLVLRHLVDTGLCRPGSRGAPPERKE